MAIFISYSHMDKVFVDQLAAHLVLNQIHVFVDRWELKVGDSITDKIQSAITDSSHLIVVLSRNSVSSDWCKREINSGLVLELERKRVIVLPVLIEECEIPLFLRDKLYADFKTDFDLGLKQVLHSIASYQASNSGRHTESDKFFMDYAYSAGKRDERFELQIDAVDFSILPEKPYSILSTIIFVGNELASNRYSMQVNAGLDNLMKMTLIMHCAEDERISKLMAYLTQDKPFQNSFKVLSPADKIEFTVAITIKRLGVFDQNEIVYYYGNIFKRIWHDIKSATPKMTVSSI